MPAYFEEIMAAIAASTSSDNTASKSSAFDSWLSNNKEWGFSSNELHQIMESVTTENGAVLNSMASTFADDCGGINADAVLTMMTNIYGTLLISIEFFFFLCIIFSQFVVVLSYFLVFLVLSLFHSLLSHSLLSLSLSLTL